MEPTLFLSGLSVFFLGLFKKLVLADTLAGAANLGFDQVANGVSLGTSAAWLAVLSYTLQIYFDFSGYSDMAVGISACFGIRLPVNFDSPYRASSMIEFWRRWHMSLSRFLREYVYIPLGGNRKGKFLRYANLLATMLIGGFWHGAGWTFIAWGAIHGVALAANHLWRDECAPNWPRLASSRVWHGFSKVLVLGVAVLAWVFFRSGTVPASLAMLGHLFHRNGGDPGSPVSWVAVVVSLAIALFLPSVQEIYRKQRVALPERSETVRDYPWVLSWRWILVVAVLAGIALGAMGRDKLFLYFNF
jgi:D-alanyl-lipoteichoic acid acyltransferase DltB (MBOAT superfamily)